MLTLVRHESANGSGGDAGRSLLDEIVREDARQTLAAALKAQFAAYVEHFADQLDENGRRLVVRNGYYSPREVLTAAGAVEVTPRCRPTANDSTPILVSSSGFLGDPAGVGTQVRADGRGVAAAVPAWGCPAGVSGRPWSSSSARRPGCRRPRSLG